MKSHWFAAALFGSTLAVGCAGSGEYAASSTVSAAEQAPAPQASPALSTATDTPAARSVQPRPAPRPRTAPAQAASAPVHAEAARPVAPPNGHFALDPRPLAG